MQTEIKPNVAEILNIPYDSKAVELVTKFDVEFTLVFGENFNLCLQLDGGSNNGFSDGAKILRYFISELAEKNKFVYGDGSIIKLGVICDGNHSTITHNTGKISDILRHLLKLDSDIRNTIGKRMILTVENVADKDELKSIINKNNGGSPEEVMSSIFVPNIDTSKSGLDGRLDHGYRSPFTYRCNSFKKRVHYQRKETIVFLLEYLWNKTMPKGTSKSMLIRTLIDLPNTRFGINDIQIAKKLTESRSSGTPKYWNSLLRDIGINPATTLKRWQKRLI